MVKVMPSAAVSLKCVYTQKSGNRFCKRQDNLTDEQEITSCKRTFRVNLLIERERKF